MPNHFGPADDVFDDKPSMEESDEIPRSGEFQKPISVLNFVHMFVFGKNAKICKCLTYFLKSETTTNLKTLNISFQF